MWTLKVIYSAAIPVGYILNGITNSTDATNYGSPAAGADGALTLKQVPMFPNNFTPGPGGSLMFPASSIYYAMQTDLTGWATTPTVFIDCSSVASCMGCPNVLPQKWGVFTQNRTGAAFGASCTLTYTGITYTNTIALEMGTQGEVVTRHSPFLEA